MNTVSSTTQPSLLMRLPVARSSGARLAFFGSVIITVACLMWLVWLRTTGNFGSLTPIFAALLTYYDYYATMAALLILLSAMLLSGSPLVRGTLRRIGERPGLVAFATVIVLGIGSLVVYRAHPLSMDEYAAFLQSQAFASGHLTGHFDPEYLDWLLPKSFQNTFLSVSTRTGEVTSGYWPSFSILLTPFTLLGISWACNPVLSGLTVLVMHRLAMRLFDGDVEVAGAVVLLTVASPVFFASGISYYSMTAHMLANCVFALLLFDATPRRLFLAGVVGSVALTLHNPVPHLLFAIPWGIWLATRPNAARNLLSIGLGYLPLSLLLGWVWFRFQGDLMAQGATVAGAAVPDTGSRLGAAFAFPTSAILFARLAGVAKLWLWAVPGLALFACMGWWKWRANTQVKLLAASALLTLIGYVFVPMDQGHGWGYRYFHSAWLVLPLLAAAWLARAPGSQARMPDLDLRSFVVTLALVTLVVGVPQRALEIREFMGTHLNQLPRYAGTEPRVVLVNVAESFYGYDLVQNEARLRDDVIIFAGRDAAANAEVMRSFRPQYHRVYSDLHGEVWSEAASTAPNQAH